MQTNRYIELNLLDALFHNIDMPEMNGFELADALSVMSLAARIFFVSGFDNFVYDSFRLVQSRLFFAQEQTQRRTAQRSRANRRKHGTFTTE